MESRDWSSDVCSSDLFPSHDTSIGEYKQYAVIADGKALAYAEMKETPDFLIARGGARYKKAVGMDSISKQAVGILAAQKLKVGSHTTECHVYNVDHPTVLKLHDSNLKSQFRELTYRTFYAKKTLILLRHYDRTDL